ncbi:MAG: dTDP-4-dehydrorhamnose reductase [Desulfobacterales bacterium]|nr:dTDP-4-dehydrorhamnose reductase [Desulfobacterales bacterium]MDX2510044.1 dTDP-4-dehydrorhamnose reductase [Desulfobacterales bacterium]
MKLLIIGSKGQLGSELVIECKRNDFSFLALDLPEFNITDQPQVKKTLADFKPSIVINASAYTNVDMAETEPEIAYTVNSDGPANLAVSCDKNRIPIIHISTDYVFDGSKGQPYAESDPVSPLGIYGKSKEKGESKLRSILKQHIILRTSWLYSAYGNNFVKTMLKLGKEKEIIKVVSDQYGCPTCAADLAEAVVYISKQITQNFKIAWGTYHYCGLGITTWHEFAKAIFEIASQYQNYKVSSVEAITTAQYPTKTKRPAFSALDCGLFKKHFGINIKPWQESLEKTIERILKDS